MKNNEVESKIQIMHKLNLEYKYIERNENPQHELMERINKHSDIQ